MKRRKESYSGKNQTDRVKVGVELPPWGGNERSKSAAIWSS
jgi:hypothetical protein